MFVKDKKTVGYGRFTISAGILYGKPKALAVQGGRKVLEREGADTDAAIASAKLALDELEASRRMQRREPHIGTVEDYIGAFEAVRIAEHERRMLRAHAHSAGQTLTATQIAVAAGYKGHYTANRLYGELGKKVAEAAGLPLWQDDAGDDVVCTFALASGERVEGEHWKWTMHSEVFEALRTLNMI